MTSPTRAPLESKFKKDFCNKLKKMNCTVLQYQQNATTVKGFPDTIWFYKKAYGFLEFKRSSFASFRPGQKEWIKRLSSWTFARVVYPENAEQILREIIEIVGAEDAKKM